MGRLSGTEASSVARFEAPGGIRAYRIPLRAFPSLDAYAYVVLAQGLATLIDVGSGFDLSNQDLLDGFATIRDEFREPIRLGDIDQILITHGHVDHYGGLTFVLGRCDAPVGVHELDLKVLINYDERLAITAKELRQFLVQAGIDEVKLTEIMAMYHWGKGRFRSIDVELTFEEIGMVWGPFRFTHVPGHCPGQVVIQLEDLLFTADHVLSRSTPHQSPETIVHYTGLGHYLESLQVVRHVSGVRLGLGGHEDPIEDILARADEISQMHFERIGKILGMLRTPMTVADVSSELFGKVEGYNQLLALEEAGAHVEYLLQRGRIGIENIDEVAGDEAKEVPIRYQGLE